MTPQDLLSVMPTAGSRVQIFAPFLESAATVFEIDIPKRKASFVAQVAWESGALLYTKEIASGAAYDVGELAKRLGNTPEADGDGQRYKGRGLLQITGLDNYKACGSALGLDLVTNPELLEQPKYAAASAAWYWKRRGLNELADQDLFGEITRRINGGFNGLDGRIQYWLRARKV
jgi:putative chitinase